MFKNLRNILMTTIFAAATFVSCNNNEAGSVPHVGAMPGDGEAPTMSVDTVGVAAAAMAAQDTVKQMDAVPVVEKSSPKASAVVLDHIDVWESDSLYARLSVEGLGIKTEFYKLTTQGETQVGGFEHKKTRSSEAYETAFWTMANQL